MPAVSILTLLAKGFCQPIYVSIHTRHYWRVKRDQHVIDGDNGGFNPHPPLLAGET